MVVQKGRSLEKAPRVISVVQVERNHVQMVAKFVAKRVEHCSECGRLFLNCRAHPQAYAHRVRLVVTEGFKNPITADFLRTCR